ncbi:hypothetical protein FKM82_024786 [Ascaphus truei]
MIICIDMNSIRVCPNERGVAFLSACVDRDPQHCSASSSLMQQRLCKRPAVHGKRIKRSFKRTSCAVLCFLSSSQLQLARGYRFGLPRLPCRKAILV